jgi:hypothetical protein
MILPSKELLKELFGEEVTTEISVQNAWCDHTGQELEWKELWFNHKSYPLDFVASKAKQWASTILTEYGLAEFHITSSNKTSHLLQTKLCPEREKACAYVGLFIEDNRVRNDSGNSWRAKYGTQADSEPEAIFQACQWILDKAR